MYLVVILIDITYEGQIIGDDTTAIESVLKADVWRDHLLKEEALLNAKLAELDKEGDEKRFEDAREEYSSRLAEVHARLSDMEAQSGPARAAALLAGRFCFFLRKDARISTSMF
jgi:ATP-binding cassette subfamily F protein 3